MSIVLGADTLCWHWRLEQGLVTPEEVLEQVAELELECVQIALHYLRNFEEEELVELAERARALGIELLASSYSVGSAAAGDTVDEGVERVRAWLRRAKLLGSPLLRLTSGFYRPELAGDKAAIEREQRHVTAVIEGSLQPAGELGIRLLLENHSDFSAAEFGAIVTATSAAQTGVFLDLINPISSFENPAGVVDRLAPLSYAGHVKDYRLRSIQMPDAHHRRGFEVMWGYPGEGVADLEDLIQRLRAGIGGRRFPLTIEGPDNSEKDDQRERLELSLALLRILIR